ncbi:heme o synthase [Lampropedia aestuarii]|nr:heme o synthase [Lampropedia aestuarii]MDH5858680.1 heme o synthase [Lampropedia aestuarii]
MNSPKLYRAPAATMPARAAPTPASGHLSGRALLRGLWVLTKPRVVQLIVFCALIGMLLALPAWPNAQQWVRIAIAAGGIWLLASAAAVFNCVIERQIDARMQRTAARPTAQGTVASGLAITVGLLMAAAGGLLLWLCINPLTACLTLATLLGYSVVYTVWLKRATEQNIVIGGASGAMPPVLGWAAMQGTVGPEAWLMFLIIFIWTPPHFWALALYRVEDYRRAGLPMLPVTHGRAYTTRHVLIYTVALWAISLLPLLQGMSGLGYGLVAFVCGAVFCAYAWRLHQHYSDALAKRTFRWSLWHLTALFAALMLDHYGLLI